MLLWPVSLGYETTSGLVCRKGVAGPAENPAGLWIPDLSGWTTADSIFRAFDPQPPKGVEDSIGFHRCSSILPCG